MTVVSRRHHLSCIVLYCIVSCCVMFISITIIIIIVKVQTSFTTLSRFRSLLMDGWMDGWMNEPLFARYYGVWIQISGQILATLPVMPSILRPGSSQGFPKESLSRPLENDMELPLEAMSNEKLTSMLVEISFV